MCTIFFSIQAWDGRENANFLEELKIYYDEVKIVKPPSSRSDSSELFFLCKSFKGLEFD